MYDYRVFLKVIFRMVSKIAPLLFSIVERMNFLG